MEYFVAKTNEIDPGINSLEWEKAKTGYIEYEPWIDRPVSKLTKSPNTTFKVLRGPEGISVLMHTDETHLRAEELEENGPICNDSCMEFFLKPSPWDVRYLNFEINPKGVMHLGVGKDRFEREFVKEERKIFSIVSDAKEGDWTLKFYIPFKVIENVYPDLEELSRGNSSHMVRANFFKCGGKTDHPHLASWTNIQIKNADFHVPDFFGRLIF